MTDDDVTRVLPILAELAACQRDLVALGVEIDRAAAPADSSWRDGCADMVTALAGLRAAAHAVSA